MTKKICFLLFVLLSMQGYAQTGIGTSTPHASAKLDVTSTNKGFLPPRVTLTAATDAVTIPSPATGLLVYNVGSVGLQAGYYYWNGANWATIATGTTAGNAVIASDLVKLYSEAWSSATGKIGNTNGYSFTVPISGRYAFDFSSTTYGSTSFTINFYVRQGTTNLASDGQVSTNNGTRVEYNGKFEVNLQAGTTYNVYVTSTNPNRGSEDYDRVYYKMVAGNLPVNQHMAERNIQLNNNYLSNDGGNEGIRVDNSGNVGIGTTSPVAKLHLSNSGAAGLELSPTAGALGGSYIQAYNRSTSDFAPLDIYASQIAVWANNSERMRITSGGNVGIGTNNPTAKLNIAGGGVKIASGLGNASTRPSVNSSTIGNYEIRGVGGGASQIDGQDDGFLRLSAGGGTNTNTQSSIDISGYSTVADMSNNIVMRTGGTERLRVDPSGNVNITGKLNIGDPTGNVSTKLVGRVTAGTFLTFDNLLFSVTTSGSRGLSLATVSGSVNFYVEGRYNNGSVVGTRTDVPVNYTITPSGSPFGWDFGRAGDTIIYHFTDADNSRMYRVTLIIMPSFINNFISIERLF